MQLSLVRVAIILLTCFETAVFSTFAFCQDGNPNAKVTTIELPYLSNYRGTDEDIIADLKRHQAILFTCNRGADSKVSGAFIERLADQKSLKALRLSGQDWQLNETHLQWIAKILWLEGLSLESDSLTDDAIRHLSRLEGLKRLQISSDLITDEGVSNALRNLSLERLEVNGKQIKGTFLNQLKNARTITSLSLAETGIDDETIAVLNKTPSLQSLNISGCRKLTDQGLSTLALNETLETLILKDTQVGEQTLATLVAYPKLTRLDLSVTGVTDQQMTYLAFIPGLERLSLDETEISSVGVEELSKSQSIKHLSLNDCRQLDSSCISAFQEMENLTSLEVRRSGLRRSTISRLRKTRQFITISWEK